MTGAEPNGRVSWDAGRASAPPRPKVEAGTVPTPELIERPQRIVIAIALVVTALAILVIAAITTANNYESVRESLVTIIKTELDEEYARDDMMLAVNVLLAVSWGLAILVALVQLLNAIAVWTRRSRSARNTFVIVTIVSQVTTGLTILLRDAAGVDLLIGGVGMMITLIAASLLVTPRVALWLRQADRRERKPLVSPAHADS